MNIVVVGGGLAGAKAVEELRAQGHEGSITLIGAEPHLPYERPPLSKGVLLGNDEPDSVFVHDQKWYDDHGVDLRRGVEATALDLDRRHVLAGGEELPYDRLLLATGSAPRRLPLADESGAPVTYLRTLDDSLALVENLGRRLVIVGGGWIGLEVASAVRNAGGEVTVVEALELPLLGPLGPRVAQVFADLHREHGVDLRLSAKVTGMEAAAGGAVVHLEDGSDLPADLVLVGIGAVPLDGLARDTGIATDNGVLVDALLRTSDPYVFAAGDIANHDHPVLGHRIRVEHWDTAIEQGRHAARVMLGADEPYTRLPYFFTDQYDLGMEYVGSVGPDGFDEVIVRGDEKGRLFTAFWLRGSHVLAGMHVNDWDAIEPIREIVAREVDVERLRDNSVPLADPALLHA